MAKVPPADRKKRKPSEDELDPCCDICGVCQNQGGRGDDIPLTGCKKCKKLACEDCRDKKKLCAKCAPFDLPANFEMVFDDDIRDTSSRVCGHSGGNLVDIPEPHRFLYDDPKLTPLVFVESHIWSGIGIHYHTSIKEDENPVWNEAEKHWQQPWDHKSRWSVDEKFNTPEEARAFVIKTLKKQYKKKKIRVCVRSSGVRSWFYKNGD